MSENQGSSTREPGSGPGPGRRKTVRKGMFVKDLKPMIYGAGDVPQPATDTVALMDDLIIDYITEMCLKAAKVAEKRGKVKVDDIKFILRKDPKKMARVEELIYMDDHIRKAKQIVDMNEVEPTPDKLNP
ncbi:transcription initiation factor IID, 18kD subunit-domain-containing protein [Umbelopsis sp. PMI_123]|nr:transcription initiation factor IID, 18kD subunit-domain-containing protein [Umbelopsis sp. PMI_123]